MGYNRKKCSSNDHWHNRLGKIRYSNKLLRVYRLTLIASAFTFPAWLYDIALVLVLVVLFFALDSSLRSFRRCR
jgi:hypothetical protein